MKKAAAKEWIPNSEETDAELSEGEFTDEESMRRYYIQSRIREMEIGIKKRRKSAKKAEKDERRHDAQETFAVKLPTALSFLHRCKQISRNNHEQRHRHTRETIIN